MSDEIKNNALAEVERILQSNGRSLKDYPTMPVLTGVLLSDVHNKTMIAASDNKGGIFFLYGFGGTAFLLPGGRTTHSRFAIPIEINEKSTCNIKMDSSQVELLSKTRLIIWDEAPMTHRFCFEALDRTISGILKFSNSNCSKVPFRGIIVVLGGDFRQILPVVPYGGRQEIVNATINSSDLWDSCEVLTLTRNMRLHLSSLNQDLTDLREFSNWLLKIGNGEVGEDVDGEAIIEIPNEMLIKDLENGLADLVDFAYPNFLEKIKTNDLAFFQERAILSPTLNDVAMLNDHLMSFILGEERSYLSSDTIGKDDISFQNDEETYSPEVLNTFTGSGLPNHKLNFKVGVLVMLPIFSHGQLCVALSRVRSKQGLKILSLDNEGQISNKTTNIVFKEVFHRLA
ncbi:hypothetical protein SLEP1_g12550 [Rubroshorea leprosula]|uniref:ATP-dependent DNA helicase n=1 Tax=Rubroshorea leprosula TaxID=152421 RepID=A0AAV5ICX5_9ROSI|nr:hypothetical protein SLEP1_g12550 [Rubroshorea leprosula]